MSAASTERPTASSRGKGTLPLRRPRSLGILNAEELAHCRAEGVRLAYDSFQTGWVTACCIDDLAEDLGRSNAQQLDSLRPPSTALDGGIRFRPWHPTDAPAFLGLLNDPEVWRFLPEAMPEPFTLELAANLIELSNASNHHEVHAVLRGNDLIGQARLLFDDAGEESGAVEVSYWLGRPFWGQGLGSRMVAKIASRAFAEHPGIMRLFARYHRDNHASALVLAKAGFANERPDPRDPAWKRVSLSRRVA